MAALFLCGPLAADVVELQDPTRLPRRIWQGTLPVLALLAVIQGILVFRRRSKLESQETQDQTIETSPEGGSGQA